MNRQRFQIGQQVATTVNWSEQNRPLPKNGEIYTVVRYHKDGSNYMFLRELSETYSYNDKYFEPVLSDRAIIELLEAQPATV